MFVRKNVVEGGGLTREERRHRKEMMKWLDDRYEEIDRKLGFRWFVLRCCGTGVGFPIS
jgi:hypothetical protein